MASETYREYADKVRAANDLVQVVGEVVTLKKAGRSLTGLCPFHREKTPSFHVDPQKELYYCFGCGSGGDLFKFVMGIHGLDYPEAVDFLAQRAGIPRPQFRGSRESHSQETRRRERVLEALKFAHERFIAQLHSPAGASAMGYLQRRGIDKARAQALGLGAAGSGWDWLLQQLVQKGFNSDEIQDAGLVVPRESKGHYDRFRQRLIFPIRDSAGRLVSFAGRALGDEEPKYINGPETQVYDKGKTLYRLFDAGHAMRRTGRAVVVEGYFDALSLAGAGVDEAVAVCGTALGVEHAKLLRRWAPLVVLFFDGDDAGRKAVHRALPVLLAEGLAVRVAFVSSGKDPDDLARQGGAKAVEAALDAADDLPGFLVKEARRSFDLALLDQRLAAMEMILGHLAALPSELARVEAGSQVAHALGFEASQVAQELKRAAQKRQRTLDVRALQETRSGSSPVSNAESVLLRFLASQLKERRLDLDRFVSELAEARLSPLTRIALERWRVAHDEQLDWGPREWVDAVTEELRDALLSIVCDPRQEPGWNEALEAVAAIRRDGYERELTQLQREIEQLKAGEVDRQQQLLGRKLELVRKLQQLRTTAVGGAPQPPIANLGGSAT